MRCLGHGIAGSRFVELGDEAVHGIDGGLTLANRTAVEGLGKPAQLERVAREGVVRVEVEAFPVSVSRRPARRCRNGSRGRRKSVVNGERVVVGDHVEVVDGEAEKERSVRDSEIKNRALPSRNTIAITGVKNSEPLVTTALENTLSSAGANRVPQVAVPTVKVAHHHHRAPLCSTSQFLQQAIDGSHGGPRSDVNNAQTEPGLVVEIDIDCTHHRALRVIR
jgi:hypothetical protein